MNIQGMGRRVMCSGGEQDVHTGWRKLLCWTQRAGATAKVKRMTRRRERREWKRDEQWPSTNTCEPSCQSS